MKEKKQENLRMFENPFFEALSKTNFIVPLLFWSPVVVYFLFLSFKNCDLFIIALGFSLGAFLWTLLEYTLHRFLFHLKSEKKWVQFVVYVFHGIHHATPNDKGRLLFPPAPASLIAISLYSLLGLTLPPPYTYPIFLGLLVFYLAYDYIHYATHHFKMTSSVGRYLKHYHLKHHFVCPNRNYGVSSPLWDYIFKTQEEKKTRKDTCLEKSSPLA